tara:strand:- start:48625 stop:49764 length:1140 start_codon:yes stop_codon:yes gene_type:complete
VKTNLLCIFTLTFLFSIIWPNKTYANDKDDNRQLNNNVSTYISSESFSNILPIKQLIKDDWRQAPAAGSSIGFTQNELGVKAYWGNVSFNVAHRLDYFVFTNPDTAQAFYLERTDQPLTTQDSYQLALKLHHQRSNGFRLGYQWQFNHFSTEINIGYWDVSATRESQITGEIFGEDNNNITGKAELTEYYSDKNFLKRLNNKNWETDGYGVTVDIAMAWQVTEQLLVDINIKDLYSNFKLKGLGYSQGNVNTEGTFINSLGGKAYLPLYKGVAGSKEYQFDLPEQVNVVAHYQAKSLNSDNFAVGYLARYKRQGEVNFYYAGVEYLLETNSLTLMLELEHLSPEIRYRNQWLDIVFATDKFDLDKAMQFSLGIAVNYAF